MDSLSEAVTEVAQLMGSNALNYFGSRLTFDVKEDNSPVTDADRTSELLAREWIERNFPGDQICGEEYGTVNPDAERVWLLDPIDGTKTFTCGVPLFGSLVAVMNRNEVMAGAANFPAVGETICAAVGTGAFLNGSRCVVSSVSQISDVVACTTTQLTKGTEMARRWSQISDGVRFVRTWGDCYGYLLVASGRADVMVDPVLNIWDIAPFELIIREAGGVISDWNGKSAIGGNGAIATNYEISEQIRAQLCFL